ncbi:MAG: hypothetical protein JWM80_5352, partial [Cyanobacteria bacterium RYN_339]|nr:hypothetical protein [Cyanobacteria bacterium RYN_339]
MGPTTFRDQGYQFGVHDPGVLPAVVHVFKGRGTARVQLLPEVALLDMRDLADADRDAALALVHEHRDRCLGLWAAGLPKAVTPPGPLATAARFDAANRVLVIELKAGTTMRVPAAGLAALAGAPDDHAALVEPIAGGDALHWPRLDRHVRVRDLVAAASGLAPWPQEVEGPARELPAEPGAAPVVRMKQVPEGDGWISVPVDPVPEAAWTPKGPPSSFKPGAAMPTVAPPPPPKPVAPPPPPPPPIGPAAAPVAPPV